MGDHLDRREFVRLTAAAGAGLSLGGLAGCKPDGTPLPRVIASAADLSASIVADFEAALNGQLIRRGQDGYDAARAIQNGRFDRRPGLIVRCADASDVARAVQFAQAEDLLVSVLAGGHSSAGHGVCDDGLVIDLTRMKGLDIDVDARVVRVEAGLRSLEIDSATAESGLATVLPECPTVGIGGFTLGGGQGMLSGKYGLSCDNLISADVVLADGSLVTASAESNADLFWGLRGGGGNFGVATAFNFRLHPVENVLAGVRLYDIGQARDALRFYREFSETEPDELSSAFRIVPTPQGPTVMIQICYAGDPTEGESAIAPLRAFGSPMMDQIGVVPYLATQAMAGGPPPGTSGVQRGGFCPVLNDDVIDAVVASSHQPIMTAFYHHHGAVVQLPRGNAAYPLRDPGFSFFMGGTWQSSTDEEAATTAVETQWSALAPQSNGVYVNSLDDEGPARVMEAYQDNYDRLVTVKNQYDPQNFFQMNQNVVPTV